MSPKNTLRTLKDFDCKGCYCKLAPELKAEAVKWEKREKSEDVKLWIIEFFNLNSEDLK